MIAGSQDPEYSWDRKPVERNVIVPSWIDDSWNQVVSPKASQIPETTVWGREAGM